MLTKARELLGDNLNKRIVFCITEDDIQFVARHKVGRALTEDELYQASKAVEAGLDFDQFRVIKTAVYDAVDSSVK